MTTTTLRDRDFDDVMSALRKHMRRSRLEHDELCATSYWHDREIIARRCKRRGRAIALIGRWLGGDHE